MFVTAELITYNANLSSDALFNSVLHAVALGAVSDTLFGCSEEEDACGYETYFLGRQRSRKTVRLTASQTQPY